MSPWRWLVRRSISSCHLEPRSFWSLTPQPFLWCCGVPHVLSFSLCKKLSGIPLDKDDFCCLDWRTLIDPERRWQESGYILVTHFCFVPISLGVEQWRLWTQQTWLYTFFPGYRRAIPSMVTELNQVVRGSCFLYFPRSSQQAQLLDIFWLLGCKKKKKNWDWLFLTLW